MLKRVVRCATIGAKNYYQDSLLVREGLNTIMKRGASSLMAHLSATQWPNDRPKIQNVCTEDGDKKGDDCSNDPQKPLDEAYIRKRRYAVLVAYNGEGYYGLQRNIGLKTIEEDILVALKKINVINEVEFDKQQMINFQRAARTDKGVSALRQVLSLEMREGVTPKEINDHLPEQIRVLAIRRVTKSFNAKNSCDSRTYSYTCPTFAFAPPDVTPTEDYRITHDVLGKLCTSKDMFAGTHNFHNFTSGRKPRDPSCKRFVMNIEHRPPVVRDGLELVHFSIRGQSFILHQIRKMMAVLISIARGYLEPSFIEEAFNSDEKLEIPVAPGVGLLLEQIHYNWYNNKYAKDGSFHENLEFTEVKDDVEAFREKFIYPMIIKHEKEHKSMLNWLLEDLPHHFEFNITESPVENVLSTETAVPDNVSSLSGETELPEDNVSSLSADTVALSSTDNLSASSAETVVFVASPTTDNSS